MDPFSSSMSESSSEVESSCSSPVHSSFNNEVKIQVSGNRKFNIPMRLDLSTMRDAFELSDDEEEEVEEIESPKNNFEQILIKKKHKKPMVFQPFSSFTELELTVKALNKFLSNTENNFQ